MSRPGITDPECYEWLHDGIVDELKEKYEALNLTYPQEEIEDLITRAMDDRIAEWTDLWLEANHDDYIEDYDNDEEALRDCAELEATGYVYENCVGEIVEQISENYLNKNIK